MVNVREKGHPPCCITTNLLLGLLRTAEALSRKATSRQEKRQQFDFFRRHAMEGAVAAVREAVSRQRPYAAGTRLSGMIRS
jgi:hypothetical protein